MGESKVVYKDGEKVRALRGKVVDPGDSFLEVHRRDGVIRINKNIILKVED